MATPRQRPDFDNSAGVVLTEMVREQLDQERRRKDSLEQRGIAVITSSGVMVALLLAVAGIAGKEQINSIPTVAKATVVIALAIFAAAALLGLLINWAYKYDEPGLKQLRQLVRERWSASEAAAAQYVAESYLDTVTSYREHGHKKAVRLLWALTLEVLAIVVLAFAVGDFILYGLK